jgi:cysteine desulfurase NifS/selenium donor protein
LEPIYLDYNATTPIDPRVRKAMLPFMDRHFGNPSSSHAFGMAARKAVDGARLQVAGVLGCEVYEIVFTGGGSESNNHAIKGAAMARQAEGDHIITSSIEHPAVTEVCRYAETRGFRVTYLPVDQYGLVDPAAVERAITPQTILISVMHANNEVGTIQPIRQIAALARSRGILFHTDCAQSLGKIPVRADDLGADLISIAGHKIYGPKGVGALYIRSGTAIEKLIHGAEQEMKQRAGTENVLEIVGMGEACAMVEEGLEDHSRQMREQRDRLETLLTDRFPELRVNGHPERRLPNTLSISFQGLEANTILSELTEVAASAGAACHSDRVDISPVLQAMGVPVEDAMGTIRLSVGRYTTEGEVERAAEALAAVVQRLGPGAAPVCAPATRQGDIKLTQYTHGLGCACKLRPQVLERVLGNLPAPMDRKVLVGADTSDDAAVYEIDETTAIVQTVDFFTPVVDDPEAFGAIAAANSLSDIYAMGGRPLFALSVVGFPSNRLPIEVLEQILGGAYSKAAEAGISIVGGHTVDDTEPKFGLAVSGIIDPRKIVTNRGARPGDVLILTKAIGTGVLATALKQGLLNGEATRLLMDTMAALNRAAAEAMQEAGANACTDITGFGLLGHLREMMAGSDTSAVIRASDVPLLDGVVGLVTSGVVPGGTLSNMEYTATYVVYDPKVPDVARTLLNDAQTSGGLLVSMPVERAGALIHSLKEAGVRATAIGEVRKAGEYRIAVEP